MSIADFDALRHTENCREAAYSDLLGETPEDHDAACQRLVADWEHDDLTVIARAVGVLK